MMTAYVKGLVGEGTSRAMLAFWFYVSMVEGGGGGELFVFRHNAHYFKATQTFPSFFFYQWERTAPAFNFGARDLSKENEY